MTQKGTSIGPATNVNVESLGPTSAIALSTQVIWGIVHDGDFSEGENRKAEM